MGTEDIEHWLELRERPESNMEDQLCPLRGQDLTLKMQENCLHFSFPLPGREEDPCKQQNKAVIQCSERIELQGGLAGATLKMLLFVLITFYKMITKT